MTRGELYALVWDKPVSEVARLVGLTGTGLAKACRRHGVQVPPRGYWARIAVGQVIERAPPPVDGHIETGVHLVADAKPKRPDATAQMLRRRTAGAQPDETPAQRATEDVAIAGECARILEQGLRQQLRAATRAFLASVEAAIPTFDEKTARAAAHWLKEASAGIAPTAPADEAAEALRGRAVRRLDTAAWLSALVGVHSPERARPAHRRSPRPREQAPGG